MKYMTEEQAEAISVRFREMVSQFSFFSYEEGHGDRQRRWIEDGFVVLGLVRDAVHSFTPALSAVRFESLREAELFERGYRLAAALIEIEEAKLPDWR